MSFIQKQFTKITIIIIQFAAFVCCSYCTWTRGTFVRDEHRRYSGRNGNNVQQALLTCQGEGIPDLGYDPSFVKVHHRFNKIVNGPHGWTRRGNMYADPNVPDTAYFTY